MVRAKQRAQPHRRAGHEAEIAAMHNISCRITSSYLNYVRNTRPEFMPALLDGLSYGESYLCEQDNWVPWEIEKTLEERLVELYDDELILFTIGRSILPLKSVGLVNTVINLFLTPERIVRYAPRLTRFFTKGVVKVEVLELGSGYATVELTIRGRQTRGACLFNQGLFSLTSELFGMGPTEVTEMQCCVNVGDLGLYDGKRYLPDETGRVFEYVGHERHGVPIGQLSEEGSFTIRGLDFGTSTCVYRLRWGGKGRPVAGMDKERALEDAIRNLEENHEKLQSAYERLHRSEEKYRTLIENASDIICLIDAQGLIQFLNRKGVELLGYTSEELQGVSVFGVVDETSRSQAVERFGLSLNGDTSVSEVVARKKNGERLVISTNPTPIIEGGAIIGVMIIARDITAEREMEARLLEAERFAAKGIVAAEIAHEINNSLANVETALFILDNISVERPHRQDILRDVKEEIDRMSGIVKGILDVYRADMNAIQPVDINAEIEKVATITQRRLKGKGITLSQRLQPGLSTISCYPGHIKQILLNLIKNAEEAVLPGRANTIEISTEENDAFVLVKVSDSGPGVPEEHIAGILTPFYTTKTTGTGLGLVLCREIARKYGGDITITSSAESGTTVTVFFGKEQ